ASTRDARRRGHAASDTPGLVISWAVLAAGSPPDASGCAKSVAPDQNRAIAVAVGRPTRGRRRDPGAPAARAGAPGQRSVRPGHLRQIALGARWTWLTGQARDCLT